MKESPPPLTKYITLSLKLFKNENKKLKKKLKLKALISLLELAVISNITGAQTNGKQKKMANEKNMELKNLFLFKTRYMKNEIVG